MNLLLFPGSKGTFLLALLVVSIFSGAGRPSYLRAADAGDVAAVTLAEVKAGTYKVTESYTVVLEYSDWAGGFTGTRRFTGTQTGNIVINAGKFTVIDRSGVSWALPGRDLKSRTIRDLGGGYSVEGDYPFVPAFGATARGIVLLGCFVVSVPLVDGEVPAFYRVNEYSAFGTTLASLSGGGSMVGSSLEATVSSTVSLTRIVGPPTIVQQPQKQTVVVGQDATFTVVAGGDGPFGYVWRRGTTVLAGRNGASLPLTNVQTVDAGSYSVTVTNSGGTATSAAAQLTVLAPPPVWFEGWESAALQVQVVSSNSPNLIAGDKRFWVAGDTASNFPECTSALNRVEIVQEEGRKALRLRSHTSPGGCAENLWVALDSRTSSALPLPLVRSTELSFFEQGSLDHPTWNGHFGCVAPPCGDTVYLRVGDDHQNEVVYVFQRATNYVEHSLTNGPSNYGYREIFLDPAGGRFSRNLYQDLASIAGSVGVGKMILGIEFGLGSAGWAMLDDLQLVPTAAAPDTTKPALAIVAPTSGQRWSNSVFTARGTASDAGSVANVWWQLNGGEWHLASTTNGWTNWTAQLPLEVRSNVLNVVALDVAGNASVTNIRSFVYAKHVPVGFRTTGKGTLSPNFSNTVLELGTVQTVTATAGAGYRFLGWEGSTSTNNRALRFLVDSNLSFTALFQDTNRPTVTVVAPATGQRSSNALALINGKASDNDQVARVWFQLNGGAWTLATGTTNWAITAGLAKGTNQFGIYSQDLTGNVSPTNRVAIIATNSFQLSLTLGIIPGAVPRAGLELQATPWLKGRIERSTNLVDWSLWLNFYTTNSRPIGLDPSVDVQAFPHGFYRAIVP